MKKEGWQSGLNKVWKGGMVEWWSGGMKVVWWSRKATKQKWEGKGGGGRGRELGDYFA